MPWKIATECMKPGFGRRLATMALLLAAVLSAASKITVPVPEDELKLTIGRSVVLDRASDIARISISNPEVADAIAVSSREVLVNAKSAGLASLVIWSKTGERSMYPVVVEPNLEPVRHLLAETFPGESIDVRATRDSLSLVGRASSQAVADRALALVVPLVKTAVSNLQVVPPPVEKQIVLRVKFVEINRNVSSSFGVNLLSTGALNTPGRITTGQFGAPNPSDVKGVIPGQNTGTSTAFTLSDALNIFAFRPDLNLGAVIRALQTKGMLQILAEPNLVTTNGKEASFLVGGEFPVPIVQGGQNAGAVTVQFREFGIRLTFLPQITANNTIKLHVKPEVSTIDLANSVVFSGFTIPALATRRMETDIELGEGQSFVIAGLIDDRITENLSKVPGLSQIPILGALFKSRSETKSKTELLVMVTPETVHPLLPDDNPLPNKMPKEFLPNIFPPRSGDNRKTAQPDDQARPATADGKPPTEPHTHFLAKPTAADTTKGATVGSTSAPAEPGKPEAEKGGR